MICGIDEAGRGALCGSMFIAGVASNENTAQILKNYGICDSKKTTKAMRSNFADLIKSLDLRFLVIEKTAKEIDELGLSACMKSALLEICHILYSPKILLDGNHNFGIKYVETIIKGDNFVPQIQAASILAKHAKDIEMAHLHAIYPHYGFLNHSGYSTKLHLQKLQDLGATTYHRQSFKAVK